MREREQTRYRAGRKQERKEEKATGSEKQEIDLEGTKGRQRW